MKAVVVENYDSIDNIRLKDVAMPELSAGQVRVRIAAASVGFVDGLIALGRYQIRPPLPYVPGGEIARTVDATGPGVEAVVVGDRVVTVAR